MAQTSGARHRVEWNQAAEEIGRDKQGIRQSRDTAEDSQASAKAKNSAGFWQTEY